MTGSTEHTVGKPHTPIAPRLRAQIMFSDWQYIGSTALSTLYLNSPLPTHTKLCFRLEFLEGMHMRDAAAATKLFSVNLGSFRTRVSQARLHLGTSMDVYIERP